MRPPPGSPRNRLLSGLLRDCAGLGAHLEPLRLPVGQQIYAPGQPVRYVYFPTTGVLSSLVQLRGGEGAEAVTVGNEGMIGLPAWLGLTHSLEQVLQQAPGEILRVPVRIFCREIAGRRRVERLVKRYAAFSLRFAYQTAVCNAHHNVMQRACRWLLNSADRAGAPELQLPQSMLAQMLGVRRQSVGSVAAELQSAGLIAYRRSRIVLTDCRGIEARACECYAAMNALYEDVVGTEL